MRVLSIVGARPQFVKAAAVSRALRSVGIEETVVHTGQHYDATMSDIFFEQLGLAPPAHHLGVGSGLHGEQTGRMLAAIEQVLLSERPDRVVVFGDTNSTLAGALAAAKLHIPVDHVEAGLRSFNRRMPEEVNRIATDHVSAYLFAPTATAVANLEREGCSPEAVHLVGDVMEDAWHLFADYTPASRALCVEPTAYVLATIHRAENTDVPERLQTIMRALLEIAAITPVLLPLHPRTKARLQALKAEIDPSGPLQIMDPVGFVEMIALERDAQLIITDSGGVQKEAYFAGVPCLTLRNETEWVELVQHGWNTLAPPTSVDAIVDAYRLALQRGVPKHGAPLYGGAEAATRVASILKQSSGKTYR